MKLNNKRKLGFISYWRDNKYRVMELEKFFDEIIDTEPTLERWREIFERLKLNQLRTIDLPNWSQTSFNKSYKDNGVDN